MLNIVGGIGGHTWPRWKLGAVQTTVGCESLSQLLVIDVVHICRQSRPALPVRVSGLHPLGALPMQACFACRYVQACNMS